MKLHKVRVHNLNSLYGKHVIDFENDLGNAPLFLILGQTGAGKSTILDAICLALFGQTPRLARITGRPDTDARLIMSHGTAKCAAEIEFSRLLPNGDRRRYRATWSCRRSHGKADGNLQDPQRSLVRLLDDDVEELIVSDKRVKYIKPAFEEHLDHLTVEDFKRSVLLAQGEFAAFLRADEGEKASILERLTNTDMYKRIGQRAATRRREARKDLEKIEQRLQDLQLLEQHEEDALKEAFEALEEEVQERREALEQAQEATLWLSQKQSLEAALASVEEQFKAAKEALDGHADILSQLAEDQRCRPAAEPLRQVEQAEAALASLQSELTPLLAQEAEAEAEFKTRQAEEESVTEARQKAIKAMEEARPMLEKAQGLQRILERCEAERDKSEQDLDDAQREQREAEAALTAALEKQQQQQKQREENKAAYDAIAFAAPLVESYAGIAYQTSHLDELIEGVGEARDERDGLKKKRKSLRQKLTLRRKKLDEAQEQLAPYEQRRAEAIKSREELLGDLPDLRTLREQIDERRQVLSEHCHTLDDALRAHGELVELFEDAQKLQEEQKATEWELEELRPQIELKQHELSRVEQRVEAEEMAIRTIERTLALDDARRELAEGEPCPLCGSAEHPYVEAHDDQFEAERKEIEASLAATKQELKERQKELQELDREMTRKTTSCQQLHEQSQELEKRRQRLLDGYRQSCAQLELEGLLISSEGEDGDFPDEANAQEEIRLILAQSRADGQDEVAQITERIKAIDDLRDELTAASEALDEARKESDSLSQEVHELEQLLALREEEIEDWSTRLASRHEKWQVECASLVALYGSFQIDVAMEQEAPESTDKEVMKDVASAFADALQEASDRKQEYEEIQQRLEALREQLKDAEQAVTQTRSADERARSRLDAAEAEAQARRQEQELAQQELTSVLGKESLEETQTRLQEAVERAEAAVEENQKALALAREARSKQGALREAKEAAITSQEGDLKAARESLQAQLEALDLDDAEGLRAKLLSDERREASQALVDDAQKAFEQTTYQRDLAREGLDEHHKKRPEVEELEARDVDAWESHVKELQRALEDKREEIGVLREKMKQHEDAKQLAAEYTDTLKKTRENFRVWETIDRLIGIGDGESFKQFAQSLNLQELVDRANARLLRLNPRYTLAVATGESGEPKLDFVIKDHHHADHERPLTTLSGGETFLVSLALALALADFRRIDMPIETLLLDEGFGTLDQDTLDIAMSTLRQLQQESSQQIGLISHVEMLKERIDTRIIVEKVGNGRSVLLVEGVPDSAVPTTAKAQATPS